MSKSESLDNRKAALTSGPVFSGLLRFSLPILLGTIVSHLYNLTDSIIVGKLVGPDALSAVSAISPINTFINLFFISLTTGAVTVSHHVGEGNQEGVQKAVNTIGALSLICGISLTVIGIIFSKAALQALGTPDDILPDATLYCQVVFAGVIGNIVYQMGNGVLRNLGDSKWPFYFLLLCSVLNVILDLAFVIFFDWGVFGVAFATAISQFVSGAGVVWRINHGNYQVHVGKGIFRIDHLECKRVLSVGLPAAVQNVGNSIAAIFVQSSVNFFGSAMIAANNVVAKVDDFVNIPVAALSIAICTFVGQNMGCYQLKRIKKGINGSIFFLTIIGICTTIFIIIFRNQLPMLFTDDAQIIEMASEGLFIMSFQCIFHATDRMLVMAMRGAGKSFVPMVTAQFGVFTRIPLAYFLGVCTGDFHGIFWALLIAAFIRAVAIAIYYYGGGWKRAVQKFEADHKRA